MAVTTTLQVAVCVPLATATVFVPADPYEVLNEAALPDEGVPPEAFQAYVPVPPVAPIVAGELVWTVWVEGAQVNAGGGGGGGGVVGR